VVADFWTTESKITAAITAMAKETQHAARKLRIVALQIVVVLRAMVLESGRQVQRAPQHRNGYIVRSHQRAVIDSSQVSEVLLRSLSAAPNRNAHVATPHPLRLLGHGVVHFIGV
jgi:hypothetical protein